MGKLVDASPVLLPGQREPGSQHGRTGVTPRTHSRRNCRGHTTRHGPSRIRARRRHSWLRDILSSPCTASKRADFLPGEIPHNCRSVTQPPLHGSGVTSRTRIVVWVVVGCRGHNTGSGKGSHVSPEVLTVVRVTRRLEARRNHSWLRTDSKGGDLLPGEFPRYCPDCGSAISGARIAPSGLTSSPTAMWQDS